MNSAHEQLAVEESLTRNRLESLIIMARGISHDFNNILTILSGRISLAKTITSDTNVVSLLADSEKVCDRASELNRQLMEFARGDCSVLAIVSLPLLLKSTTELVLKDKRVKYVFQFEKSIPPIVGNEVQLRQVFMNLLINAVQAMPEGGTITIGMECVETLADGEAERLGPYVKAYIRDEGMGIPERFIPRIFDCNFSTKPNGSGLGLTICSMVVKKHGGYIRVISEEDKGTTVNVYFPARI